MSTLDVKDPSNEFIDIVRNHLSNGQLDQLIILFSDEKYLEQLQDTSWDVIPIIVKHLNGKEARSNGLQKCCNACLEEIAKKGHPDETLLEFLAEAEDLNNDVKFLAVLRPLAIVLLRLPRRRGQSMEWCFKTVQQHFKTLPVQDLCQVNEEVEINGSSVKRVKDLYLGVVPFFKPLVSEIRRCRNDTDSDLVTQRKALICFILKILERPFILLDDASLESVNIAMEEMIGCLSDLVVDPMIFLELTKEDNDLFLMSRECGTHISGLDSYLLKNQVPIQSVAVFYHLLLSKQIRLESIPCVYHPTFVFHHVLYLACFLLKADENSIVYKGLQLVESVLARLSATVLTACVLDLPVHYDFTKFLIQIMVYCPFKNSRILAINLFKSYLFKFDLKGQYLLLFNIPKSVAHSSSSLRGFLMTQIKEIVHKTSNENATSIYFTGKCLCDLVSMYCNVPQGPNTHLLEFSDEVMSALNLIRFLILRDKNNQTGIWTYLRTLQDGFFKNLTESLKYSREYCSQLDMDANCQDPSERLSVTVGNEEISPRSEDEKLQAKNVFDLIEDVMERVKECLAESGIMKGEVSSS